MADSMEIIHQNNAYSLTMLKEITPIERLMILLIGIPGSGKSTLARTLVQCIDAEHQNSWVVLNQDAVGNRKKMESLTLDQLHQNRNIIIDRCNFDATQRSHWLNLIQLFPNYQSLALIVPDYCNIDVCIPRAITRGNDGIHSNETDWRLVCNRMLSEFQYPSYEEGIQYIYHCHSYDDLFLLIEAICTSYKNK